MEIENNKEQVPFEYYAEQFKKLVPADAASRLEEVSWDGTAFRVTLLGTTYTITHPVYSINPTPVLPVQTFS